MSPPEHLFTDVVPTTFSRTLLKRRGTRKERTIYRQAALFLFAAANPLRCNKPTFPARTHGAINAHRDTDGLHSSQGSTKRRKDAQQGFSTKNMVFRPKKRALRPGKCPLESRTHVINYNRSRIIQILQQCYLRGTHGA